MNLWSHHRRKNDMAYQKAKHAKKLTEKSIFEPFSAINFLSEIQKTGQLFDEKHLFAGVLTMKSLVLFIYSFVKE